MKSKNSHKQRAWRTLASVPVLTVASLLVLGGSLVPTVRADSTQDQINQLKVQNAQTQQSLGSLQVQANSYQGAIDALQAQIANLQSQINANQTKQAEVQAQINANQTELNNERKELGSDIKAMYVDGSPTTIEMLASSHNLSDFVDKEEYRTVVQNKIQDTLKKIAALQNQLNDQKVQIDSLLKQQQDQQAQLSSDQAQQNQLLAYNQGQQSQLNTQIQQNNAKISDLQRQQLLANAKLAHGAVHYGAIGGGGYPWSDAVCLNGSHTDADCYPANVGESLAYNWGYLPNNAWDANGFQYRNCTSYAAFKVMQTTGISVSGYGNAKNWVQNTPYKVDQHPVSGDVEAAVFTGGFYGHVMFVDHVNGDGTVNVSQYNYAGQGEYSTMTIDASSAYFIHFP